MAQLAPVVKDRYTDEERAIAAGYLLHMRAGTLKALASSDKYVELDNGFGAVNQRRYYRDAESHERFLLYWAGYEVAKGQLYHP